MKSSDILFRCSSLGHLMTLPKEKAAKDAGELSEGAKTHCSDIYVVKKWDRHEEVANRFTEKGNLVEDDSLTIISRLTKTLLIKNTEEKANDFIRGTSDALVKVGENIEIIRDAKSSYSIFSFYRSRSKKLNPIYYWQIMGYLWLWNAKVGFIDYCLNNTPYHIVEAELRRESYNHPNYEIPAWMEIQIIANHVYDLKTFEEYIQARGHHPIDDLSNAVINSFIEIPIKERLFSFEVKINEEDIERIKEQVIKAREFIRKNFNL